MLFFKKSTPDPECLNYEKTKASGDYKCGDVLERLRNDFANKCYLCGTKNPISLNVEHFRPHKSNIDLKFGWKNLFWACVHCNSTKGDGFVDIIDCTDINQNIENRLKLIIKPFPKEIPIIEALDSESTTISTKKLLDLIYNGSTPLKEIESANLRDEILKDIVEFQQYLFEYTKDSNTKELKLIMLEKIKSHLSKKSSFTSFKRWIIRDNAGLKFLEEYFD
ncbi:hypothetical protein SMI01S_11810 [Sphingobacterium mizutaii NBRC 14946 = DSM 11724]|uniref:HNH domain-containing protein n=2 Tax=Sphingobacterium mizutaii TaxID=1010 RepID=A0AAJ5C0T3_9SPHI|nr:HNH endonuclease [Sphingobacterium mizutaii]GEM67575.1 hypothetical protein SMI01S_11810 [Sphingobacterium mizutaii NBRC 14946 = DSM 11724]SDL14525.1 TIGR02646 family protein [Sphingobacterium mizutaii]SNV52162.1 Uncharacterised protein [Sphingobacterium mizutaii]